MNPQQQPQNIDRELNLISELITKNNSGIIAIPAKPTPDAIAAGTALYMALTKMGKTVSLICAQAPETDISGADKITTSINTGGNNLVVSFPYKEGAIDKVDYNIQNGKFNLIIIPREGQSKLNPKDVDFSYSGGKIEFIITVDTPNLNSLGDIYTKNQSTFDGKNIVNIDRHLINNNFGTINLVVKSAAATSELVLKVLQNMKVQLDKDIATNLYAGIVAATNNFSSYSVNADTFETVADLLRAGAIKKPLRQFARPGMPQMNGINSYPQNMMNSMSQNNYGGSPQMNRSVNRQPQMSQSVQNSQGNPSQGQNQPQQSQGQAQNFQQNTPQQQSFDRQTRSVDQVEKVNNDQESDDNSDPETWLKPKIFSESDGLV